MAFTCTQIMVSDYGNNRVAMWRVTADAATGFIPAFPVPVKDAYYTVENMASAPTMNLPVLALNKGPTGTAIVGQVSMTNCVSGDIYRVMVTSGA